MMVGSKLPAQICRIPYKILNLFWQQSQDLPLFVEIQAILLLVGLASIKFAAISHTFGSSVNIDRLTMLFQVCAYDFISVGVFGMLGPT